VIAAAQAGQHNEKRHSYGHALIVDPWGKVIAQLEVWPRTPIRMALDPFATISTPTVRVEV
jgi:predicted amidohydrolase